MTKENSNSNLNSQDARLHASEKAMGRVGLPREDMPATASVFPPMHEHDLSGVDAGVFNSGVFNSTASTILSPRFSFLARWRNFTESIGQRMGAKEKQGSGLLRELVEGGPFVAWEFDLETSCYTYVSPAAEDLLGFDLREWCQPGFWEAQVHEEDRPLREQALQHCEALQQHQEKGSSEIEYRMRHRDGRWVWVRDTISMASGNLAGIKIDITERVRALRRQHAAEDESADLRDRLLEAQKLESLGELASGIAHDFNNLLTTIVGNCQRLRRTNAEPAAIEELDQIQQAAERANILTKQLLVFGRQDAMQQEILDPNHQLRAIREQLIRTLGSGVSLEFHLGQDVQPISADAGQFQQAILNLVINAKEAMSGSGDLEISTDSISFEGVSSCSSAVLGRSGSHVRISIRDSGIGMGPDVLSRIFEPFFTTKLGGGSSGLGLSTVHGIIGQLGGHIEVSSTEGRGSVFHLYVPAVLDEFAELPSSEEVLGGTRGQSILLCEDEAGVRKLLTDVLREAGYTVLVASGGQEALRLAGLHLDQIDLIVTDVVMPGLSGREIVEKLLDANPGLPHLFMSGYTSETLARGNTLGKDAHFLEKPFLPDALLSKVGELLGTPIQ